MSKHAAIAYNLKDGTKRCVARQTCVSDSYSFQCPSPRKIADMHTMAVMTADQLRIRARVHVAMPSLNIGCVVGASISFHPGYLPPPGYPHRCLRLVCQRSLVPDAKLVMTPWSRACFVAASRCLRSSYHPQAWDDNEVDTNLLLCWQDLSGSHAQVPCSCYISSTLLVCL